MGLLSEGTPLSWVKTKELADHVRHHGIIQFIEQYKKLESRTNDVLKYGDEVEYTLLHVDHEKKKVKLLLKAVPILDILQQREKECPEDHPTTWRPEYANYMVEGTPGKPFGALIAHFNVVEANMQKRREELNKLLNGPEQIALSLTVFPRIGCKDFTEPSWEPTPTKGASHSLFFPDKAIMQGHPRFETLTRNIRQRREAKPAINIPIFKDTKTPNPFKEDFSQYGDDGEAKRASKPDHIYMDAMGFGMGCSCLQMTFQACCIEEARQLYDQLTPLCPILMALSAASPIFRGYLADIDCRWSVIAGSVDDRTMQERGIDKIPKDSNVQRIYKSRYDSIDSYLSPTSCQYNDIDLVINEDVQKQLLASDIDPLLAQHIAHLFIRDPVSLFSEKIHQNDKEDTDHFENIQSTNWQTMRFKLPPSNSKIGWRVEFRPTEVQLTDFENAAFTVFVVLLTRVILSFNLNLLIPISKVDKNMKTAEERDSVRKGKFYFRKDLLTGTSPPEAKECISKCKAKCDINKCKEKTNVEDEYTLMTIDEIINGKDQKFPGLVPLIENYLENVECDVDTKCTITQYLNLIRHRASGKLMTTARWIREFVLNHSAYNNDSEVSDEITYDLICACDKITRHEGEYPGFLPPYASKTQDDLPPAVTKYYDVLHSNGKTSNSPMETN